MFIASLLLLTEFVLSFRLKGINYSPRQGPDWALNKCKSQTDINLDMKTLAAYTNRVRIFSLTDCNAAEMVLKATKPLGMKVWIGMWIGEKNANFNAELSKLKLLIEQGWITSQVVGLHVGSETLYRNDITVEQAIVNLKSVQQELLVAKIDLPVTVADVIDAYYSYSPLFDAVDIVSGNAFPFWEKVEAKDGVKRLVNRSKELAKKAKRNNKVFLLSETGWASNGFHPAASTASSEAQRIYFKDFICSKDLQQFEYYYFSSFDDNWKRSPYDKVETVEAHFGLFYANRTLKPWIASLKFPRDCPVPIVPSPVAPPSDDVHDDHDSTTILPPSPSTDQPVLNKSTGSTLKIKAILPFIILVVVVGLG